MTLPNTLFFRTATTLILAAILLLTITLISVGYFVLIPLGKRAMDDFSALLILSAQTWVEVPPETRPDLEQELLANHHITLGKESFPLSSPSPQPPYLSLLKQVMESRLGGTVTVGAHPDHAGWYWVDIPMADQRLRFGFTHDRIGARPPIALLTIIVAVLIFAISTALVLAMRLSQPLTALSRATAAIGRGERNLALPDSGPDEIVTLSRNVEHMATEITKLLENRTTLLAGLSHDLRTPLTRIRLALEFLPDDGNNELHSGLTQDVEEMDELLHETLLLARGMESRETLELCDLSEVISEVIAELLAGRPSGTTRVDWMPAAPLLWPVPPESLKRVLHNLLENAVRYGNGAPVSVVLHREQGIPVILTLDRGPGIPDDEKEAVFQPFYRLERSRSASTGGSGLGLAIVRQLCDAQGWDISFQDRDGGGTESHLLLKA